ncbi:hypothetical protein M2360_000731 [Rhizobium sp. SG_E_25_P2]|nr:hypothetical protein [Rhizobium sp. SG_E_25_P2]
MNHTAIPRRGAAFAQADVTRAIKGAEKAGFEVGEIICTPKGIRIIAAGHSSRARADHNPWDEVYDDE